MRCRSVRTRADCAVQMLYSSVVSAAETTAADIIQLTFRSEVLGPLQIIHLRQRVLLLPQESLLIIKLPWPRYAIQ